MRTLAVPSVYLFGWRAGGEFFLRDGHSVLKQAVFALFLPLPSSHPLLSPPLPFSLSFPSLPLCFIVSQLNMYSFPFIGT